MKRLPVWVSVLAVFAAAGCGSTTTGSGHALSPAGSPSRPDFPTPSQSAPATASEAPSATSSNRPPPSSPTMQQRADRLTAQTNGEAHELAALPGGAEAATYDRAGNIQFWRSTGTTVNWSQVGASTYPAEVDGMPYSVAVRGALLSRMAHATFIVTGQFTNDNSGHAVAYTTGTRGWGAIKAETNGNIGPSGAPVGANRIGLSYGFSFVGGLLKTEDCPTNEPIASCGSDHVDKLWVWTGHDFKRA
jgi:hypothetical protein